LSWNARKSSLEIYGAVVEAGNGIMGVVALLSERHRYRGGGWASVAGVDIGMKSFQYRSMMAQMAGANNSLSNK
jgi:hypothetical protein